MPEPIEPQTAPNAPTLTLSRVGRGLAIFSLGMLAMMFVFRPG
jgi:hypothetical protein